MPTPAIADEPEPPPIVFPVIGDVNYTDTFGAPRSGGRTHAGTDIMTYDVKGLPVVASADGVISWISNDCCHLAIDHGGGWSTWYIHLNNDTPGTDDGQGWGIADDIEVGTTVVAGQLIGWVGDSGNAEWVAPQLHFETRHNGAAVNPYPALAAAPVLDEPWQDTYDGQFRDDDTSVHQDNIELIYDLGITRGCNPPENDRYCPQQSLTRGQVAAFLRRYLDLPAAANDYFVDDGSSIFEADINALTDAGIAFGCSATEFCADEPLRRDEMAAMLVNTFATSDPERYANPDDTDWFIDDAESPFHGAINQLKYAGVTVGCDPPDNVNYCPDQSLSRAQMATFLARAIAP
jgi:hypothetical protein